MWLNLHQLGFLCLGSDHNLRQGAVEKGGGQRIRSWGGQSFNAQFQQRVGDKFEFTIFEGEACL